MKNHLKELILLKRVGRIESGRHEYNIWSYQRNGRYYFDYSP